MRELQDNPAPEVGRLLRVLLLRDSEVPADAVAGMLWIDPHKTGRRTPNMWGEDGNGVRLIKLEES
jgi:hypothetical protein